MGLVTYQLVRHVRRRQAEASGLRIFFKFFALSGIFLEPLDTVQSIVDQCDCYLCEVRAGQYWRLENLSSFDEFLARRFSEARRKAYYLMSIHEHLPPEARRELKEVGWTKGLELAKIARRDRQGFDCATWLHKARELSKEDFRREVEKELTGRAEEPSELIYFKVYKTQVPVIEQAIETAALMLGTDKSRGYCLEMICADFLAGAHLDNGDPEILLNSISRYYKFLPGEQQRTFLENLREKAS